MRIEIMDKNRLYGKALLPVLIWGFWAFGSFICTFTTGWYFGIFAIALSAGAYMLCRRQARGLFVLSITCVFAVALIGFIFPGSFIPLLLCLIWLPPLSYFMTRGQINYSAPGRHGDTEDFSWLNNYDTEPRGFHGVLGEPYCSAGCLGDAGRYSSSAALNSNDGVCGFCRKPVKASAYGPGCAVIPYEGIALFVCPDCAGKAKQYMEDYHKCCMCQKAIESGR